MTDQVLGKYRILEQIGSGGFATVHRAIDTSLGREVALKVLYPQLSADPSVVERFQREARAAARLDHSAIVPIYEVGAIEDRHFIAMKYVPGSDLQEVLEAGSLPPKQIVAIIGRVAEALDYAHARRLVHRDLKPSNIIVGETTQDVVLMDFGLVRSSEQSAVTASGAVLGTPDYMSPEQSEPLPSRPVDHRSDVYSLGVLAYEMYTGRVPFTGSTPLAVLRGHADKEPPDPCKLKAGLPESLGQALLKALAKSPENRYQSAGDFATALAAASKEMSIRDECRQRYAEAKSLVTQARRELGRIDTLMPEYPDPEGLRATVNPRHATPTWWILSASVLLFVGVFCGIAVGWFILPVQWENASPAQLRPDFQEMYIRLIAEDYAETQDLDKARQRLGVAFWDDEELPRALMQVEKEQDGQPALNVRRLARDLEAAAPAADDEETPGLIARLRPGTLVCGLVLLIVALTVGGLYLYARLVEKREAPARTAGRRPWNRHSSRREKE